MRRYVRSNQPEFAMTLPAPKPATLGLHAPSATKIFVLDTSVLLHDHRAISRFEEHAVVVPMTVLEELDRFKVGSDTKNFEARECIRMIDRLAGDAPIDRWVPLGEGAFRVVLRRNAQVPEGLMEDSNDHRILACALECAQEEPDTRIVLVSKDINLRLKARALGLEAEDYKSDRVREQKLRHTGRTVLEEVDPEVIRKLHVHGSSRKITALDPHRETNHYYILRNGSAAALGFYRESARCIERVDKVHACGIKPRNAEQAFGLHAVMNPEVSLVTLCGVAGTGKTLLALAGALEQRGRYEQIILARPIVALSNRDLGYLPGDADDKVGPYMQPLWDNLRFIEQQFGEHERKRKAIDEMKAEGRILVCPLAYIRGRSISNALFIVDEAQNLTPHEVKTIVTRAGENCKIILTGDVRQIDTPYLDEQSNGLSYVMDRMRGQSVYAHVTLERGERSELANVANRLL